MRQGRVETRKPKISHRNMLTHLFSPSFLPFFSPPRPLGPQLRGRCRLYL
jgi:hypothetical protein